MKQTHLKSRLTLKTLHLLLLLLPVFGLSPALGAEEVWIERLPTAPPEQSCLSIRALRAYAKANPGNWIGTTVAASALAHAGWKLSRTDLQKSRVLVNEMVDDVARAFEPAILELLKKEPPLPEGMDIIRLGDNLLAKPPQAELYAALAKWDRNLTWDLRGYIEMLRPARRGMLQSFRNGLHSKAADASLAARNLPALSRIVARAMAKHLLKEAFQKNRRIVGQAVIARAHRAMMRLKFERLLGRAAAISAAAIAQGVMIDMVISSELGDGTWAGAYADNPLPLLEGMSEEEACRWARDYPKIGASVVALQAAVMLDASDILADGGTPEASEALEAKEEDAPGPASFSAAPPVSLAW